MATLQHRMSSQAASQAGSVASSQPVPLSLGSPTHVAVLVKDNHASRLALKVAKTFIRNKQKDTLTLVHVVSSELASFSAEQKVLAPFNQDVDFQPCIDYKVLVQYEGMTMPEVVTEFVNIARPHLLVIGSEGLCNDTLNEMEASRRPGQGLPGANKRAQPMPIGATQVHLTPLGSTIRRKPSRLSTAMRLAQALHQQVPLLLVKNNTVGAYSTGNSNGLRCMMDLTSTSRHALDWALSRLQSGRGDSMILAVGKALDGNHEGRVRQEAQRLLTTFGVQVSVSSMGGARKRLMREPSHVGLPSAVVDDDIDVLITQAPRCRDLAQATVDIIIKTRCSVLLWPPDRLADGTVVKPPHPLRQMLDETVPEEERPLLKPKHQPELLVIDGPWRGRGPRYTFRERDGEVGEGWEPAMMPLRMPMLRRSMSEMLSGGEAAKERLHRALTRTATLAATRTGLFHLNDHDSGGDDDGSPGAAPVRRPPAPWGTGAGGVIGGGASSTMTTAEAAASAVAAVDEEEERTTWPPRAGPAPWQRRGPRAQIQEAMRAMGAIAEDGEVAELPLPAPRAGNAPAGKAAGVNLLVASSASAGATATATATAAAARPGSSAGPRSSNSGTGPRHSSSGNTAQLLASSGGPANHVTSVAEGEQHATAVPLQRQGSQTAPARQHWATLQQQVLGGQGAGGGAGLPAVVGKGGATAKPVFAAFGRTLPSSFSALPHIGASESMRSRRSFNSQGSTGGGSTAASAAAAAAVAAEEQRAQDEAKRVHLTPHRALPLGAGPVLAAA